MKKINKITNVATAFLISIACLLSATATAFAQETENTAKSVYLGGQPFGIKMYARGAIVTKTEAFQSETGSCCPAKDSGLKENDLITKANGEKISGNAQLETIVAESKGSALSLYIERDGKEMQLEVEPKKDENGVFRIGVWVRDSCAGIGTITFYDEENQTFAALGHGICDVDTNKLMPLENGEIVSSSISGVTKAQPGKAGTLNGYFNLTTEGTLSQNTELGIYGNYYENCQKGKKIEIAQMNDVKIGDAKILTTVEGTEPKEYSVKIVGLCNKDTNNNKNFVIEITDSGLLEKTGGIVQGMSGSPIIQNDKLVGAVTHVFINEPNKGYCAFAQNMVSNFKNNNNILCENVA